MLRIIPFICLVLTAAPAWARDCIGMVPAGTSAFWSELEAGARRTAGELQLELYTRGPAQEGSLSLIHI